MTMTKAERDEYLAIRKQAALQIDAETAEVNWWWANELDPYGTENADEGYCCINRCYFVRAPGSGVWVHESGLPETTFEALRKRPGRGGHIRRRVGPAGNLEQS
jgi:hypothetical protein